MNSPIIATLSKKIVQTVDDTLVLVLIREKMNEEKYRRFAELNERDFVLCKTDESRVWKLVHKDLYTVNDGRRARFDFMRCNALELVKGSFDFITIGFVTDTKAAIGMQEILF